MKIIFTALNPNDENQEFYFDNVIGMEMVTDSANIPFLRVKTAEFQTVEVNLRKYDYKVVLDEASTSDHKESEEYEDSNRLYSVFETIGAMLNASKKNGTTDMWFDGERILSPNKSDINWLMTFFEELVDETKVDFLTVTGYYDPEEDKRNNEVDDHTGMYYLEIE